MYFYIVHQINQTIRRDDDKDGSVNVRTLILGGILYIITHAIISNPNSSMYLYKNYLLYLFLLDIFAMGIIYKQYYGRTILREMNDYDSDIYDEKEHKYYPKNTDIGNSIKIPNNLNNNEIKETTTSVEIKTNRTSKNSSCSKKESSIKPILQEQQNE